MFGNIANISAFFAGNVEAMCTSSLWATFEKRDIVAIELRKRRIPTAKICCHAVTLSLAPRFSGIEPTRNFSRVITIPLRREQSEARTAVVHRSFIEPSGNLTRRERLSLSVLNRVETSHCSVSTGR